MREDIKRNMTRWNAADGDRIDPVAQACRRLHLRVELCPCGGEDRPGRPYKLHCRQCINDLDAIELAWIATEATARH
jgi:hypothetical protein